MDTPLTRWYCDVCGTPIDDASKGYVIWRSRGTGPISDFKIIHQQKCDDSSFSSSMPLSDFLGDDGHAHLLSLLSYGAIKAVLGTVAKQPRVADMEEFVDFFRRVQVPYYEEARRRFSDPQVLEALSDTNEVFPYLQSNLRELVDR